jgi:hypothetical protein
MFFEYQISIVINPSILMSSITHIEIYYLPLSKMGTYFYTTNGRNNKFDKNKIYKLTLILKQATHYILNLSWARRRNISTSRKVTNSFSHSLCNSPLKVEVEE